MDEAKLTQLLGPESARLAIETMQRWQIVDETHAVISRERLKRLLKAAESWRSQHDFGEGHTEAQILRLSGLQPGDLDPIP